MKYKKFIYKTAFFTALIFLLLSEQAKSQNRPPISKEVIRAIEDSLGVNIEEIGPNDLEEILKKAEKTSTIEIPDEPDQDINTQEKQDHSRAVIEGVKEASEKVEKLVETATEDLRQGSPEIDIYGFNYLQEREIKLFNSALDVRPPDNYVLGVGDELNIVVFGYSDYNEVFTVEKDGYIQPRLVGRIYLKGLSLAQARKLIKQRFSNVYNLNSSDFEISLNYSRVITVNIVGEVNNPGSYTFPAINTAFNVLSFIGGPSPIGSIRNVQVKRNGELAGSFDLYEYIFEPEKQGDIFLQNNDYLYVAKRDKVIEIAGEVVRPGKYELKKDEGINELLLFCAGLKPSSYTEKVQIKRYVKNEIQLLDFNYDELVSSRKNLELQNGDVVTFRKIPEEFKNFVEIKGAVYYPGMYQYQEGMTVKNLIQESGGFLSDVYLKEAYVIRTDENFKRRSFKIDLEKVYLEENSDQNIVLQPKDVIETFTTSYFNDKFGVSIEGAVRNPRSFELVEGMTLRDLILLAGGLQPFAYIEKAYITRLNAEDNSTEFLSFPLDTTLKMITLDTIPIQRNDKVRILSQLDFIKENKVSIGGQISRPGDYDLWEGLYLSDLIAIAGGLTEDAFLERAYVIRTLADLTKEQITVNLKELLTSNVGDVELERKDQVQIFSVKTFHTEFPIEVNGLVRVPGLFTYAQGQTLADVILMAGGLKFEAANSKIEVARIANFNEAVSMDIPIEIEIISLEISPDLENDTEANSFEIQPFDQIYVRRTPGFEFQEKVVLRGEVVFPGHYVLLTKKETLTELINRAGGLTEYAYAGGATLFRSEGGLGQVVMNLGMAMRREKSKYNYVLKEGDSIDIPRLQELVTIRGNLDFPFITGDSTINAPYTIGKRARYYIKNYGAGFAKKSQKRKTSVMHANGHVNDTKSFFGAKIFPKVEEGSVISVPKKDKVRRRDDPNWEKKDNSGVLRMIETIIATTTSAVTLYALIRAANN